MSLRYGKGPGIFSTLVLADGQAIPRMTQVHMVGHDGKGVVAGAGNELAAVPLGTRWDF